VSSKNGPSRGSGLSKRARTLSRPPSRSPSSATSRPAIYPSTRICLAVFPLKLLNDDDIAPAVKGAVTTMEAAFRQSMGALGQGFHWFVFAGGTVNACKDGGLSIPFAGETYTYKTPI